MLKNLMVSYIDAKIMIGDGVNTQIIRSYFQCSKSAASSAFLSYITLKPNNVIYEQSQKLHYRSEDYQTLFFQNHSQLQFLDILSLSINGPL